MKHALRLAGQCEIVPIMGEKAAKLPDGGFAAPMDSGAIIEAVTIRRVEDIHDAAVALRDFVANYGLRAAMCDDIASK